MQIKYNKILLIFITISIIVSVAVSIQRFNLEKDFKQVELVISLNKVRELVLKEGYNENQLLEELKSKGITSIAIQEDTIESLLFQGKIAFLNTNDLTRIKFIENLQYSDSSQISPGEFMVISNDFSLLQRMYNNFQQYYGQGTLLKDIFNEGDYGFIGHADEEEILKLGLGFSEEDIIEIKKLGLNVVLRPRNSSKINMETLQKKMSSLEGFEDISSIIFDEEEVLGYPSEKMLLETAKYLQKNNYPFGIIEFTSQKGIQNIANNISQLAVRVHSITSEEMENISLNTAIDRWVRAAQERNIRIFYLNPFLNAREGNLIQYNLNYIENIKDSLIQKNFSIGKASLFSIYQIPSFMIYLISLGIISAGLLLLNEFFIIFRKYTLILLIIALAILFILNNVMGQLFLIKILALISALIFPALAIIKNKNYFIEEQLKKRQELIGMLNNIFIGISRVMIISLAGGLIIGALLTHYKFILAIQLFSGIKIAYIFPLVLVAFYLWWVKKEDKRNIIDDFKKPVLFEHVFFVLIFMVFGIIYIARSGNFSFLPVPEIEEKMRLMLENILIARPRSKEFLIGYPLISLAIAMNYLKFNFLKIPLIIMGTVAPVTIVNTFCHVHTSVSFSLLRTFNGYWLGLLLGIFLSLILYIYYSYFREKISINNNE